jgi:uncharacterized protein
MISVEYWMSTFGNRIHITDEEAPVAAAKTLLTEMQAVGKPVELHTCAGDNHNISGNFNLAMQRTMAFFDKYVKGP